jgi:hypothetical protein
MASTTKSILSSLTTPKILANNDERRRIRNAPTVSNLEDFRRNLRELLDETELSVLVTKIETGTIKFLILTAAWMENGTNTFLPVTSKKQKEPVLRLRSPRL